ncbi:uncharacterized protein BDZ99DRAFT_468546 [Mytilinidion resinicola]|uniref:Uncharacterized protein n=1 Tax=Mytilinidion resinicola TaxID=574789 RepID=A0A6A6Y209_9PEZI|nr:uncharacterized protein BDZ99DRAFT_468546 [Mytilinidion resinicola]KAF2802851.1 hypothetical protein BDZ99DRAFT_468546 [Mytilinidion resinicola]
MPFRDVQNLGVNDYTKVWYTQALTDKGIAMLAKRDIKRAEMITAYTPVLLVYMDPQLSTLEQEKYLKNAVN